MYFILYVKIISLLTFTSLKMHITLFNVLIHGILVFTTAFIFALSKNYAFFAAPLLTFSFALCSFALRTTDNSSFTLSRHPCNF